MKGKTPAEIFGVTGFPMRALSTRRAVCGSSRDPLPNQSKGITQLQHVSNTLEGALTIRPL